MSNQAQEKLSRCHNSSTSAQLLSHLSCEFMLSFQGLHGYFYRLDIFLTTYTRAYYVGKLSLQQPILSTPGHVSRLMSLYSKPILGLVIILGINCLLTWDPREISEPEMGPAPLQTTCKLCSSSWIAAHVSLDSPAFQCVELLIFKKIFLEKRIAEFTRLISQNPSKQKKKTQQHALHENKCTKYFLCSGSSS